MTQPAPYRIRFTLDAADEYRWVKVARNNRVIGASSESYTEPRGAIENLMANMPGYTKVDGGLLNGATETVSQLLAKAERRGVDRGRRQASTGCGCGWCCASMPPGTEHRGPGHHGCTAAKAAS